MWVEEVQGEGVHRACREGKAASGWQFFLMMPSSPIPLNQFINTGIQGSVQVQL